jgi:hypothetical protein
MAMRFTNKSNETLVELEVYNSFGNFSYYTTRYTE